MGHFSQDARLFTQYDLSTSFDVAREVQGYFLAMGTKFDAACTADADRVTCVGTFVDSLDEAAGVDPHNGTWTMSMSEGRVTTISYSGSNSSLASEVAIWAAANRPDFWSNRFETCVTEVNCLRLVDASFLMTPDAAIALVEIVPDYLAAIG
jgi:hypothetical protein